MMADSTTSTPPTGDTLESLGRPVDDVPEEATVENLGKPLSTEGGSELESLGQPAPPSNKQSDTQVFTKQVNRGAVTAGVAVPTVAAATKIGAVVGAPFFPPFGSIGGAAIGFGFGLGASMLASEFVIDATTAFDAGKKFFIDRKDIGEDQRALGNAGETFGGAFGGAAALLREGLKHSSRLSVAELAKSESRGGVVDKLLHSMRTQPATVIASETAAGAGAAVGAFGAEKVAPNNIYARFLAEFAGGLLSPHRKTAKLGAPIANMVKRGVLKVTGKTAENDAAAVAQEMVRKFGDDPDALSEALLTENWDELGVQLTPAQLTGAKVFAVYENDLASNRSATGAHAAETALRAYESLNRLANALVSSGDPQLIVIAAQARKAQFEVALTAQVEELSQGLVNRIRGLSDDAPASRQSIGKQLSEGFTGLVKQWRAAETKLWAAIDQDVPLDKADNLSDAWSTISSEMNAPRLNAFPGKADVLDVLNKLTTPDDLGGADLSGFGDDAAAWGARLLGEQTPTAPTEQYRVSLLINLRSELGDLASAAARAGRTNEARRLNNLKFAVGEDIGVAMGGDPGYQQAVEFSAAGNEVFTRSTIGAKGRGREIPENALRDAFGGSDERVAMHLDELDDATSFMTSKEFDPSVTGPLTKEVFDAQDRFVRLATRDLVEIRINPTTGEETAVVSLSKLENFMKTRASLLEKFPAVKKRLEDVKTDKLKADEFAKVARGETSAFNTSIFAKLAKTENPTELVQNTLFSSSRQTPEADLTKLVELAKGAGPDAVDGLAQIVMNAAIKASSAGKNGTIAFDLLEHHMMSPLKEGGQPLIDVLISQGVVTEGVKKTLMRVFKTAKNLETAANTVQKEGIPTDLTSALTDFLVRVIGARVATAAGKATGGSGGASIQVAAEGAKLARRTIINSPLAEFGNLLHRMGNDTKFMALMLKIPVNQKEKMELVRNIHAYALFAGYSAFRDGAEDIKLRVHEGYNP